MSPSLPPVPPWNSVLPWITGIPLIAGLLGAPSSAAQRPADPLGDSAENVVEHVVARQPDGYWTPERMARALPIGLLGPVSRALGELTAPRSTQAARPANVPGSATTTSSRWATGGAIARTTGRVFLTMNGSDFVCSASALRSANRDVVVTAGHCVKNGSGAWAENWTFVPGYDRGRKPYGTFAARRMFVAGPWSRGGDDSYDVAMVAVAPSGGLHLTDRVGGQAIGFNTRRGQRIFSFGFPADPPYDGEHLVYCAGGAHDDPHELTHDQGMRCDLTAGASGGPWLTGFDPATGLGTVTSVSSFKYSDDRGTMYGPYFDAVIEQLFTSAQQT